MRSHRKTSQRTVKKSQEGKFSTQKLKKNLPRNATDLIYILINQAVSKRQIQYVLAGKSEDYHEIIPLAIKLAKMEKSKREKLKNSLSKL